MCLVCPFGTGSGRGGRGSQDSRSWFAIKGSSLPLVCSVSALQLLTENLYVSQTGREPLENLVERVC